MIMYLSPLANHFKILTSRPEVNIIIDEARSMGYIFCGIFICDDDSNINCRPSTCPNERRRDQMRALVRIALRVTLLLHYAANIELFGSRWSLRNINTNEWKYHLYLWGYLEANRHASWTTNGLVWNERSRKNVTRPLKMSARMRWEL